MHANFDRSPLSGVILVDLMAAMEAMVMAMTVMAVALVGFSYLYPAMPKKKQSVGEASMARVTDRPELKFEPRYQNMKLNWAVFRQFGKSSAGFLLRDHSGAMVAADGFPLSGSSVDDEEILAQAVRWSEGLGFPNVEIDVSYSNLLGSGVVGLNGPGLSFNYSSVHVNKSAKIVAKLGCLKPFSWKKGKHIPKELDGSIKVDAMEIPYIF
ncbi:unnamed protein product [Cuscuta epithymum]|uniref:RNase H type-1 domain-containing protein n=1 Tax=Cuscuta epithymum TaxID=186058 RepID=A0AAV0FGH4_9ASTE|nr:unnamed protein product [Cuscuta epithymum]